MLSYFEKNITALVSDRVKIDLTRISTRSFHCLVLKGGKISPDRH
jgi:hypothetical protein